LNRAERSAEAINLLCPRESQFTQFEAWLVYRLGRFSTVGKQKDGIIKNRGEMTIRGRKKIRDWRYEDESRK